MEPRGKVEPDPPPPPAMRARRCGWDREVSAPAWGRFVAAVLRWTSLGFPCRPNALICFTSAGAVTNKPPPPPSSPLQSPSPSPSLLSPAHRSRRQRMDVSHKADTWTDGRATNGVLPVFGRHVINARDLLPSKYVWGRLYPGGCICWNCASPSICRLNIEIYI